jgi:hypothetical protein
VILFHVAHGPTVVSEKGKLVADADKGDKSNLWDRFSGLQPTDGKALPKTTRKWLGGVNLCSDPPTPTLPFSGVLPGDCMRACSKTSSSWSARTASSTEKDTPVPLGVRRPR